MNKLVKITYKIDKIDKINKKNKEKQGVVKQI